MKQRLWRKSPLDLVLLTYSVAQVVVTLYLAFSWEAGSLPFRGGALLLMAVLTAYNIIVVSHLFTHSAWFTSVRLNGLVSVLNSVNIGQSVQAYQFTHVRNHHRFNNDPVGPDGTTRDISSTYRDGHDGDHAPLLRYAFGGALQSLWTRGGEMLLVRRLWRVGPDEKLLLSLASRRPAVRARELRQIQLDRVAHTAALLLGAAISWRWMLLCYLPAFFLALAMVNVQNYYRHYGANPEERAADSVSHYGGLYNLVTFNDGYHQEHHLSPTTHWSQLPKVRRQQAERLASQQRIVSPVPAMLGFLDRGRPLLHRSGSPTVAAGDLGVGGSARSAS